MNNLLPPESRKNIQKEYRIRLLTVFLLALSFLGIVVLLSFLPSLIFSTTKEKALLSEKKNITESVVSLESENLNNLIADMKDKVDNLKNGNEEVPIYGIIKKILSAKNSGIKITGIIFGKINEGSIPVTVEGVGRSRDGLVSFQKKLDAEEIFRNVSLPVSNLAKSDSLDFNISLVVKIK